MQRLLRRVLPSSHRPLHIEAAHLVDVNAGRVRPRRSPGTSRRSLGRRSWQSRHNSALVNPELVGMISERDIAQHLNEHQIAEFAERVYATA
ncbi:hypothetical protein [Streptomyces viridochromogenes]|uniref:hypothetical protein n=1 Tax=Streptomyces viridochromogenes TaxID=1938 RepID=UPI003F7FA418